MAMDPKDLQLRDGRRAPTNRVTSRGEGSRTSNWKSFKARALSQALAGFGVPKVRTRP